VLAGVIDLSFCTHLVITSGVVVFDDSEYNVNVNDFNNHSDDVFLSSSTSVLSAQQNAYENLDD